VFYRVFLRQLLVLQLYASHWIKDKPTMQIKPTAPSKVTATLRWSTFAAPSRFYFLAKKMIPIFWGIAILLGVIGLVLGLLFAPTDATQGDAYRIIFIHVPSAWMSMVLYLAMAFWGAMGLIFNARLAYRLSYSIAITGAIMTFIALWTGALWGKPTWGAWWVWDARLTSELILLFLYIGYLSLYHAIEDPKKAAKAASLIAIIGAINVPIIYFSVKWWNTLHQGASVTITKTSMDSHMLAAMLIMTFAFWAYAFATIFTRVNTMTLDEESHTEWVQQELNILGKHI
jgi:heme exporter protein C